MAVKWLTLLIAISFASAMQSERAREQLGISVRKQLKTAAIGAAGALMRLRMNEDASDEEEVKRVDLPTSIALMMAPVLATSASAATATAVSLAWVLDIGPFHIPHFRMPNVQRDRAGSYIFLVLSFQ